MGENLEEVEEGPYVMYNLTVTHLGAYGQRERGRRGKKIRDFVGIG